ncbi:GON-4-like protein [Strongylocentrotus purpuratus]|uniref:GON-4-like protein n=1 Tax=Strongylocentrotus purpuratus TaxID=7668 RepID=A0A7M7N799_STRPU|nr:GON-4-like protein [Strongylocentrotus purpuratus]
MEEGGKEQSEPSENGKSLDPVNKEVECPNSSESHRVSAEAKADASRGETSQDAAETGSSNNEVEREGQVEPMESSEASDQQPDTKDTNDPEGDVVTTPVTACSKEADMEEHVASPAREQSETHSAHSSHEKPCSIGENDQCEEIAMSKATVFSSSPSKGKESVSVRVLDDQALDSQPSTPPEKGRSEIFDESMLTESPAYSEDGRLVIGTPRSPESPGDEAVPGPGFEVDRTRHPADVGCEVEIAGDFLPLDSFPSTSQHTPSTSQHTPSTSQYTPSTSFCENPETETDLSLNQTPPRTGPKSIRSKKRKRKRLVLARKKQRKVMPVRRVVQEEDNLVQAIDQALDLDDDLERKLEENAAKNNLTAINVKSILHHVITNEHVLSMVRNTMTDAGLVEIEREPAAYTPKLTRAKLKEATEKVGNMPYVWPLSPVKNKKATPGFIEINFSDDTSSDDEDYEPTLDELMREESDYESVTSQMSDFGSPCASTPPRSVQPSITESEMEGSPAPESAPATDTPKTSHRPVARHLQVVPVPMGPPPPPLNPDRLGDDDAFLRELAAVTKEEANIIAHRTRSKLTIDKPLEAIEASFIAPDAEHDMYDVYESDHEDIEWKKWLSSLYRTEDTTHTEPTDDEQNDPEYNFLAEEEPVDKEDFRTDRAVRVSKKELNGLLDEVVEAYGDDVDWLDDFDMGIFDQNPQSSLLGSLMQQKQKFSPSKFYTMPSSFSGKPSTSSPSGASTSSKFRLGEVLSSIMAAALSADTTPAAETPAATTVVEATMATSATETTAMVTEATVLSASTAMVTEVTFPLKSEAVTTVATGQPQPQPPPQQPQAQPLQQTQPSVAAPTVPPVVQQQVPEVSVRQAPPVAWTIEAKTLPSLTLNGEELQQFQQQLQQHTQLLCQMFLMARENDTLTDCANQSKQYLAELDLLAGVNEDGMRSQGNVDQRQAQFQSFFRSCNLGGALELLKTPKLPIIEEEEEFREKKAVTRSKPPPFRIELGDMMAHSKVFIHAELLPKNMFHDISRSSKIIFVEGEDKLVTRGLHQFGKFENGFHLIQSLMMPCKTSSQIRNRIKNLLCHRKCKVDVNNPIVIYKSTKQLVHSPSMCAVVRPHQATAPVNIRNNKKLPKWVLNIQGGQPHIKDCFLESEQERGMRRVQTLSPLKPKLHIPYQTPAQDQVQVPVQDGGPVIGQFHPGATPHYILASNVGLTAGGLILQPGQQIIPPGLLPRTVCEVKYVIDSPQMSAIAAGNAPPAEGLPSVPQSSTGAESVASPATQSVASSYANPVLNLPPSSTVSLAAQMARAATNVTSSIAPQMEMDNITETTSHSVVRTLQFSDFHASTAQTALEKINAESYQTNGSERIAMPLPDTQAEIALHTTQEALNQSAERTAQAEAALSVFSSKRRTSLVPLGVGPRNTVRELIMKKRNKKLSPRRRLGGFVSMSSLASKGMSSLNKFKLGTARNSPERLRLRSPNAKQSPGKMTVRRDGDKERSPDSAKANQGLAESGESIMTQNATGERRTSDTDEDCIPLEAALRQLDEEEETMRTASPKVIAAENLIALRCDESLSDIDASSKVQKEVQSIPVSTALTASPEMGPSPSTKHSPLQMTVRMDDKVATEAHVPVRLASSEPMQGITIGSSVGSASQIITVNRVQSPTVELSRTASPVVVAPPAIPDGDTPSTIPSLPAVQQEDTTSQMSEGAASANGNPKLPFDLAMDQSEMMASTATGGKSPTLDEQSAAREFLSGGEQGGPGEDGEEEMETGRRSNVKVAAKRIKSKLRKDLESTVVLLDPDIVNQDPYKEEREMAFAKDFLDRVKEALHDNLDQYRNFLRVFNEYSEDPNSSIANLYYAVKYVLSERPDLIEEFTAFMPPDVALQCGVFLECLEFSKARLFLRQVEVHFYKQPAHIQRIVKTMVQWGETQRNYQDLKEALIPLLKGQPHLEQELSMLFPDSRPPENYMMDFEEINLTDEKKMACDDFEEIELSESEEEEEGTITKQQGRGATYRNILDPWKGLNDELQYGTRSCKCNCHEKSQDSRVQRKTRHCAYCSAMVTRAELISSLRGLCPGRSRPLRDRSVSRRGGGGPGEGKRRGRGSKMADAAKGEETTNEAVNHLSQMCDNLADYLQDNASATEDEDDVEDDEEGGDEDHDDDEEDDDEDDHDDDDDVDIGEEDEDEDELGVATGDDDDDDDVADHEDDIEGHEDEEEEEEEEEEEDVADDRDDEDDDDDEGGVISEDDADDEAEDGGELNHMTSGESTDDLNGDHSPCTSQGSRETMDSGNSNSGSQLSTSPASSHTTLLGSGVTMDTDSRSLTCSPMEFQNTLKDEEKAVDAIVDSEKEGVPASDVVSAEPEIKTKTAPEGMESESTDGKMTDEQGLGSDAIASARSGVQETKRREQETERREQETERREQETPVPAGDKEMMVDGGEQEEPNDGDKVEQEGGGAAVDPQQSSTGETDGASSGSTWNRDADRVLLQACQEKGAREETFINVASQLTDKTPQQVKERFAILMKLFHHDEEPSNDEDDEEEESEGEEDEEEDEDDGGDQTDS